MSISFTTNYLQYEIKMTKQTQNVYVVGLAMVLIFLLINFIVAIVWIKRKNKYLEFICKNILYNKNQHKQMKFNITNPSKKHLKRQPSIDINSNKNNNRPIISYHNVIKSSQTKIDIKQKLIEIDPILSEQLSNIQQDIHQKISMKDVGKLNHLKTIKKWIDCFSFYQPFLALIFLLISFSDPLESQEHQSFLQENILVFGGMTLIISSFLIYLFVNCSRVFYLFLNVFDKSKSKVCPLQEESPTVNALIRQQEEGDKTRKKIVFKSSKFITCNGIQTQISIRQKIKQGNEVQQQQSVGQIQVQRKPIEKTNKKIVITQKLKGSFYILDIVYLIPLVITIVMVFVSVFF